MQGATEAKRPTRWWVAVLFAVIVCIFIVSAVVSLLVGLVYNPSPNSIGAQLIETILMLASFLAVAAWVRFKEGRPVSSLGFRLGLGSLAPEPTATASTSELPVTMQFVMPIVLELPLFL